MRHDLVVMGSSNKADDLSSVRAERSPAALPARRGARWARSRPPAGSAKDMLNVVATGLAVVMVVVAFGPARSLGWGAVGASLLAAVVLWLARDT
jgi:hypothetical protein